VLQEILDIIIVIWLSVLTLIMFLSMNKLKSKVKSFKSKNYKSKRYIVFSIIVNSSKVSKDEIEICIRNSVKELLGKVWLELSNPKVIYFREDTYEGIISTNRIGYKAVLASMPFCKEINGKKVLVFSRRITGNLKKARREIGIE